MLRSIGSLACIIGCVAYGALPAAAPPPAKRPGWIADASSAPIPNINAMGKINGVPFSVDRSELLLDNVLRLQQGKDTFGKRNFKIRFSVFDYGHKLDGKVIIVRDTSHDFPLPPMVEMDPNGKLLDSVSVKHYTMRLQFGKRHGDHLPGAIYLCARDRQKSFVVGHFNAALTAKAALDETE
jgi:hypothetical protein